MPALLPSSSAHTHTCTHTHAHTQPAHTHTCNTHMHTLTPAHTHTCTHSHMHTLTHAQIHIKFSWHDAFQKGGFFGGEKKASKFVSISVLWTSLLHGCLTLLSPSLFTYSLLSSLFSPSLLPSYLLPSSSSPCPPQVKYQLPMSVAVFCSTLGPFSHRLENPKTLTATMV